MDFNPQVLQQGLINKRKAEETPDTTSTVDGVAQARGTGRLDVKNERMAGQEGAQFVRMMLDPQERARVSRWMESFGLSNQGMQWNQARMMMAAQAQQPQQGGQQ